jgi:glycosyltransferase involved in cell wall biosynthesis
MPSLNEVQDDWRSLDRPELQVATNVRLISHEEFTSCPDIHVEHISPGLLVRTLRFFPRVAACAYAWKLLRACDKQAVLIVNGSMPIWLFVGLLNRILYRSRRRILCWDIFIEVDEGWKRKLMSAALKGMTLSVLWSRKQVKPHSEFLGIPAERFVFVPYKANHSKGVRYNLPVGNFIFAGGNGKRDYKCLVDAVRDSGIPVIISATDPAVRKSIEPLPNVILLAAPEPAFAQLQAASRFVVIPMIHTGLKGGGEANFCNAMWHGKPVIAVDSIAAEDYVLDGETGYVIPSGDSQALRQRIIELWNDPERVAKMGKAALHHVEDNFSHAAFIRRLLLLASLLAISEEKTTPRDVS